MNSCIYKYFVPEFIKRMYCVSLSPLASTLYVYEITENIVLSSEMLSVKIRATEQKSVISSSLPSLGNIRP
jgi:hypothetical protein